MTSGEFRAAMTALRLSQTWLADRLGVNVTTVNRWATGKRPVPGSVAFALELLAEKLAMRSVNPHPPPDGANGFPAIG